MARPDGLTTPIIIYMVLRNVILQLTAFARIDGVFLALLWTASFVTMLFFPTSAWSSMLAVATPFLVGQRLKAFRDNALDGVISFRRAYVYLWYVFFNASLIFAAVQFIYFRFLDNGAFMATLISACQTIALIYKEQNMPVTELNETIEALRNASDTQLVVAFFTQNLTIGTFLSLPIAAIMRRSKK